MHVPMDDEPSPADEFLSYMDFTPLGYIPNFWPGAGGRDGGAAGAGAGGAAAVVWAKAFHSGELARFPKPKGTKLADLTTPGLERVKPRCPRWASALACQFGLPIAIVALLFAISYALVLLGPLRGISSRYMKGADGPAYASLDDYVEEEDGSAEL
jgi:hypothetical protein